jgi:ArsR family transcriptional regulator, arsenate/arsenite/antimonite-responsive transcriptional repressor
MVYAKTQLFENELQAKAELFKALAHPARLAILKYLAETNTCITGDFAEELPLSRSTVGQHLKELKDARMIVGTTEGAKTYYCLNPEKIHEIKQMFLSFIDQIDTNQCVNNPYE